MIENIDTLAPTVLNVIIYVASPSLEYILKDTLKKRLGVTKDFIHDVDTMKALNLAKMDSYVAPLTGGKWLINVNADKISKKDLITALNLNTVFGVTVYWVSKYAVFKYLTGLDIVKKQGVYCAQFYLGKLMYNDITNLHSKLVPKKNALPKDLLHYVAKTYNYDVQAVCDLFNLVRSGNEVTTKKDIIELVGVGGNSTDSFVVGLLKSSYTTEKGKKTAISRNLKLLQDLSYTYKFNTIKNYILNTVDGFIEMKQLQIMGYYRKFNKIIPENFDSKRLSRLKRFETVVLEDVSLPRLLNLKLCLKHFSDFDAQISLVQAVIMYLDSLGVVKEC